MARQDSLSLRDTVSTFFRRIGVLGVTVALLTLGTLIATYVVSPIYQTSGKVIVVGKKESTGVLKAPVESGFSTVLHLDVEEADLNNAMEILLSLDLWMMTVKKLGLPFFDGSRKGKWYRAEWVEKLDGKAERSPGDVKSKSGREPTGGLQKIEKKALALRSGCKVEPAPRSRVLDISFRYGDPEKAQEILTTHLNLYIPYHASVYSVEGALGFFTKEVTQEKEKYEEALQKLTDFKQKWKIFIPESEEKELIALNRTFDDSIAKLDGEIKQYKSMLAVIDKGRIPTGQLASILDPVVSVIAAQLLAATEKKLQVSQDFDPGTRDYRDSDKLVKKLTKTFRVALLEKMNNLSVQRASLEGSRKDKVDRLALILEKTQEASKYKLAADIAKKRYLRYLDKVEEVRVETLVDATHLANVRIVSKPFLPSAPVFPRRKLMVIAAFLISIPLGIGMMQVVNLFDTTFHTPAELEASTGYEVLASLTKLQPLPDNPEQDGKS